MRVTEYLTATPEGIDKAAFLLKEGKLVSFGTETVYGLGALASSDKAVAGIFAAKGRPQFNPLISHFATAEQALVHASLSGKMKETAWTLAEAFWPGPLTLILPRAACSSISDLASAGLPTLALRVPKSETTLTLLRKVNAPIAAPSANRSGAVSPSTAAHVLASLDGRIDAVLDSGPCLVGVESTVLDLTQDIPIILRPGGITLEALTSVCGIVHQAQTLQEALPSSPGMLASHYAPSLPVRLNAHHVEKDEALLAFGPPAPNATLVWNLSATENLEEAASRLFAGLRFLDAEGQKLGLKRIAVQPIPPRGLGVAIRDRLHRAAEPRPPKSV
ncbi:L-threonylcarbamoyladenylate synthase [Swingsia samuiensis]|uniref:Threonylcarbamoyl-AMP synthase n=1 Tax=Swingsia samuiensis TaxID=1293412 RepID=A0A4Y6UFT0_9PROT|nr:L-threonylcarbamoyladenylate synthase [Swingsia samuiensis]QDH16413.1 threonylcarbamoyl-AMP synthase [Swingsia samuiensis]